MIDFDGEAAITIGPLTVRITKAKISQMTDEEVLRSERTALQQRIDEINKELEPG